ncbi:MAG: NAD(P)-dependent alcohol dehydrogenase [Planctomycetes bacterium]|nr:NAD(P)-dependent alcohol dehydrogenase [Planctomycetota bacterium]MCB9935614.1 NAD(P)-dependent alcohol dehydrogenase [Planctomycetota bacterium]
MRAAAQYRYGGPEVLQLEQRPLPAVGDDEVLVRVRAAGVDRGVWHLMAGLPYLMRVVGFGLRAPKNPVPGMDLAGTVAAVGKNVTRFRVGDEVFGVGKGSFAEYAVAPEAKLAHKPANLSFEQAAALAISGMTALQGLRDVAKLQAGEKVLILGASGGVGSYAVQIAKALGAEVTGVGSTSKLELVKSLGADHVIDYTREDITDSGTRYDVILDIGGNRSLSKLRRALKPRGRLVIVGGENGGRLLGGLDRLLRAMLLSPFISQTLTSFISGEKQEDLQALKEMAEAGKLTPSIDRAFPLAEAADAVRYLEQGCARGKVVILP